MSTELTGGESTGDIMSMSSLLSPIYALNI